MRFINCLNIIFFPEINNWGKNVVMGIIGNAKFASCNFTELRQITARDE